MQAALTRLNLPSFRKRKGNAPEVAIVQQRAFDELINCTSQPSALSIFHERGTYEALWEDPKTTFKSLAELFAQDPHKLPSAFVPAAKAHACAQFVQQRFEQAKFQF